jgi:hypothetical protein
MSALPLRPARRAVSVLLLFSSIAQAQNGGLTSPQQALGFTIGDDYMLANYSQLTDWWKKLDQQSDRMKLVSIGKTAEGRDQWMAIITSPANHARLEHFRGIAERLARAEGLSDEQARALAKDGKAVVWIDGGLHATEVLGAHQLMEQVWQMVSRNDEETMRLLDDVIQLVVHANPDGMELVSNWYMRNSEKTRRSTQGIPRLYQKYIGHDNNRDFYLNAQAESENMSRVMYREWYPQVMYNHHQTGPAGTVMFAPPFRDPHNHNIDPLLINGLSLVGAAMHTRFAAEAKPGVVMRGAASYQTWWNGGLRTTAYFHNIIGILTETVGNPTPIEIPFIPQRQLSTGDITYPIPPQRWHFRQSIDYSITANRAILDLASRYREHFLYNIYLMGKNAIAKGSRDSWTNYPSRIAAAEEAAARAGATRSSGFSGPPSADRKYYDEYLRDPAQRDPRGYVIPSDQPDFPTATRFVNALMKSGVEIHRATAPFSVAGKSYPADSWVIRTAQAFRAHVLDLMEPQDYPNDIPYPGGPPRAPYDNAGYTLAMQMGVRYDRVLEGFDGPFVKVSEPVIAKTPGGAVASGGAGWILPASYNDAITVAHRLMKAGVPVYRITRAAAGRPAGSLYIPSSGSARSILQDFADTRGLRFASAGSAPAASGMTRIRPVRIGLADTYGGSMPSGWIRWLLEQMEVPFQVVYAPRLDQGNLGNDFDLIIFADGIIPASDTTTSGGGGGFGRIPPREEVPAEYHERLGRISVGTTVPHLKTFLENGGRIVTIGSSTNLASHLNLPVASHLVERQPAGTVRALPREKFYVPASLLEVSVDSAAPVAWGLSGKAIVMFDESPVFRLDPGAVAAGTVRPVAWFADAQPLRSGWAWGQTYLEGGVAVAEAKVGKGTLHLFGPEITYRAQPAGTFKFLFNAILN